MLGVGTEPTYASSETERMMKLQEVLLRAMAKKMTWWQAAEIIGVTERTMRRWRERLEAHGYSGSTMDCSRPAISIG
jgi:predicted ArsR family transcriptional regulator